MPEIIFEKLQVKESMHVTAGKPPPMPEKNGLKPATCCSSATASNTSCDGAFA